MVVVVCRCVDAVKWREKQDWRPVQGLEGRGVFAESIVCRGTPAVFSLSMLKHGEDLPLLCKLSVSLPGQTSFSTPPTLPQL